MKKRFKKILTNLVLLLASLLIMVILTELALHLMISGPREETQAKLYQFDDRLAWRAIPNQKTYLKTDEYETLFQTNSYGFRGPEWTRSKPSDTFRILILGDSFAESLQVNRENRFSELLQSELAKCSFLSGQKVEIINTGASSYNTAQELVMFDTEGRSFEPDLTLLMVCWNDIKMNTKKWHPFHQVDLPCFEWTGTQLKLTNVPLPQRKERPFAAKTVEPSMKEWMLAHSRLYLLLRGAVNNNHSLLNLAVKLGLKRLPDEMRMGPDGQIDQIPLEDYLWHKPYLKELAEGWDMTERMIVYLKQQTEKINSRFLVMNIPHPVEVNDDAWSDTCRKYGIPVDWNRHQVGQELQLRCARHHIECLADIEPWLKRARKLTSAGKPLYLKRNGHWTVDGHILAAELLFKKIKSLYDPVENK